ncbi:hypothetical protein GPL21_36975 [Bradyrhizobium pachyrhizi]|uniref:Uncharacterized protein n=1 Tax=Bradyrhizobium pachyrhizi TaxID=280333 RepID=A0A844T2P3_9BRAD|nr:hypothetical protein [Bradyrhizobium pachyrhizi]MVT70659.1 hypothetical protein [Bradyrhizobium pachyrhizi]
MGHGMVRMFFAVEREGTWEDRAIIEMPCGSIAGNFAFAVDAVREIARETDVQMVEHLGTVN